MQQYAERYPVGERNVKMLDDTLEMTNNGLRAGDLVRYVHISSIQLLVCLKRALTR